jgi:glycosyltransferase involved in cell wall biosynthesis
MKKAIIFYDFFSEQGGIERVMLFQAKTLKEKGYDVIFAFAYVDPKLRDEKLKRFKVIEYGKLPFRNETLQIVFSVFKSSNINELKNAGVIICHSFPSSFMALKLKKRHNTPYMLMIHHPSQFLYAVKKEWKNNSYKRKFAYWAGKLLNNPLKKLDVYCIKNASKIIVPGKAVRRIVKETYGIEGKIIYPTVDKNFFPDKLNSKEMDSLGLEKGYILASGRITEQKRFDYLIKALAKSQLKKKQVVFIGKENPDTKNHLEKLGKKLGVINIKFLGPRDINLLRKVYSSAKLTVLTCPKEWFGLVPIEAMSCGCPVVAWKDNFGPEETVQDNINGFLAKPYSTLDLSRKMMAAYNKKWNPKRIINSARRFSEEVIAKEFMDIIDSSL